MQGNKESSRWVQPRVALVTVIVVVTAGLRIIPHPMNFAPIGALALFSGAYFPSKRAAVLVPVLSLAAGDLFTGFHKLIPWVYASFLVSVAIGWWLRREKSAARIGAATLAGSAQFFLITNFALWASSIGSYPRTSAGLVECYTAGLPLLGNTLAGDAFYAALLFGGMALAERRFPSLREPLAGIAAQT
jgi:uncharacterized membrane protein